MKQSRRTCLSLAILLLLTAGCGQKGPLYHPDEEARRDRPSPVTAEPGNGPL